MNSESSPPRVLPTVYSLKPNAFFSRRPRLGSVTLMAIVVMVVLSIVVLTYNYIGVSTHKMLHHTYYNEKVLAVFDALDVIARSAVEDQSTLNDLLNLEPGGEKDIKRSVAGDIEHFKLLGEDADGNSRLAEKFNDALEVWAGVKDLQPMPDFTTVRPTPVGAKPLPKGLQAVGTPEVKGRVSIRIRLKHDIQFQDKFTIPKREVSMEYEFKRARIIPPFFRHFSLWVKNGIVDKEYPEKFDEKGNFNWAANPLTGKSATGGVLFVRSSGDGTFLGAQGDYRGQDMKGRFEKDLGYIYLGGKEKAHLNLMAGDIDKNAPYSETFHLYRGATTDFYKVWSTEFSNFIENSQQQKPDEGQAPDKPGSPNVFQRGVDFFKGIVKDAYNWIKGGLKYALQLDDLEQGSKNMTDSNALPLYYVVRKDYGYAVEWGEPSYQRFGFARGGEKQAQAIVSSSLHLYGANTDGANLGLKDPGDSSKYAAGDFACPTIVLGNVYRRCLSLSGYKQRRKGDPKGTEVGSSDRKFEVQAGPVEFFDGYEDLMNRSQDPTMEKEKRPIWVWDARVRWNMDSANAGGGGSGGTSGGGGGEANGTYLPLSGAGLFGRLIPGLSKLWDKNKAEMAKKLFEKSVSPPEETADAKKGLGGRVDDEDDTSPPFAIGMSPLFQLLGERKFFEASKHAMAPADGYLYSGVSPYFEELMRCFSFTVSGLGSIDQAIKKIQPPPTGVADRAVRDALTGGKTRWDQLVKGPDAKTLRTEFRIKEIKPEIHIKDEKMKKYWLNDSPDAPTFFPFSFPDVWDNRGGTPGSAKNNFRDYFEKNWVSSWPVDKANTPGDFFKLYFTPLMTNPARVLPYNYSLRFICTDLREIFSLDPKERKNLLTKVFPAEVTDGIGYIEPGVNDWYLKPELDQETQDLPLNDKVLGRIHDGRNKPENKERLGSAYLFMDEYAGSISVPSAVDTEDCFRGRSFWQDKGGGEEGLMTWEQATKRFVERVQGGTALHLNTILGVADTKIELGREGETTIIGGGAILVPGEIAILGDLKASSPVWLVADKITIGGNAKIVQAGLVAHKTISIGGSPADTLGIFGSVICGEWDKSSFLKSGKRVISYNPAFKDIHSDGNLITKVEPRIRKFASGDI